MKRWLGNYREQPEKHGPRAPSRVLLVFGVIAVVLAGPAVTSCRGQGSPRAGPAPRMPAPESRSEVTEASVETLATDLHIVWALDFAPDGRIFLSERPGRIRVIEPETGLVADPWAEVSVWASSESGLMGLALHPSFADSPFVYVMYTYRRAAGAMARVSRFREEQGRGAAEDVALDGIPAAARHSGGALAFGPDGMLYVGTGDATQPELAQDMNSLAGKILRIGPDGSVPADNPFRGSPIYALGLRNVQGFDWDPETGRMFATMHGPSGEWGYYGRDEVNVIRAGANYGWPVVLGAVGDAGYADPLLEYRPAVAPGGAAFYEGPIVDWRGDLFFGALRAAHLHRVVLTEDRTEVRALEQLWPGRYGRVRAVKRGPDGHLYFGTSNRDGRGRVGPEDDRVLRVIPSR